MIKSILDYLIKLLISDVKRRAILIDALKYAEPLTLDEFLKNPIEGDCWVYTSSGWYISFYIIDAGMFTVPDDYTNPAGLSGVTHVRHIPIPEAPK